MAPIFAALLAIGKEFVDDWRLARQNQRDVEKAVTENRIRLAQSQSEYNHEWEMRALEGRDAILRRLSFLIWSSPMIWAIFDPAGVQRYFSITLAALPEWYSYGYLAISGAIWGVAELKAAGVNFGVKK